MGLDNLLAANPSTVLILIVLLLSQVIQALVLRRGQNECKPSGNPHGYLTPTQHTYLYQIWQAIVQKVKGGDLKE